MRRVRVTGRTRGMLQHSCQGGTDYVCLDYFIQHNRRLQQFFFSYVRFCRKRSGYLDRYLSHLPFTDVGAV